MKSKIKETNEDKYLRLLIGDGKPFQERKDYILYLLENIGGDKTVNRLCEALEKKLFLNPITRYQSIEILAALSDDRVIELLLRIAKDDDDNEVRARLGCRNSAILVKVASVGCISDSVMHPIKHRPLID
jgi:HEAT repeat protein